MVLNKCDTDDQAADIFTKSFTDEVKWKHACSLIHVGRSVKDPIAVPEDKKTAVKEHREGRNATKTPPIGKALKEPFEEPSEEPSRRAPIVPHLEVEEMPAPSTKTASTAPDIDDHQAWDLLTHGTRGINIMAGPQEWIEIAEW
eukprot:1769156-Amphidinium_carterae.1